MPMHTGQFVRRPGGRWLGLLAFALALIVVTIGAPFTSRASSFQGGFTVNTGPDTVSGNLYLAAFRATVDASVRGDVIVGAGLSTIGGTIDGSLVVIAGRADLSGTVNGSVYAAAGNVTLQGTVDGDVVVSGGRVTIASTARINGDLILSGLITSNAAPVQGSVYGLTASLTQSGTVGGNMEMQSDRLQLERGAQIRGDLRYQSPSTVTINAGARVAGETVRTNSTPWTGVADGALTPFGNMLRLIWQLVLGALMIAVAPRAMYRLAQHGATMVAPTIIGLVGIVAVPMSAVMLTVSGVALPVGIIVLLLTLIGVYTSQILVGTTLGWLILPRSWRDGSRGYLLLSMVIGMIIIGALRMAPVPYLGLAVTAVVTIWGFGTALAIFMDLTSVRLRQTLAPR